MAGRRHPHRLRRQPAGHAHFPATVRGRLVGVLALCAAACALPAAMMAWSRIEDARMARRETAGLAPARELVQVIRLTQQHRGMAAVWLGGNEAAAAQRAGRRAPAPNAAPARLGGPAH